MKRPISRTHTAEVLSRRVSREVPVSWGKDPLSEFWDMAGSNVVTNFANNPPDLKRLRKVDTAFLKIVEHQRQPRNVVVSLLLISAHTAFRAASNIIMSGMPTQSYPLIRNVLEHAGYAAMIARDPALGEVWLRRHDSPETKKKQRNMFSTTAMKAAVGAFDTALLKRWDYLYEYTIDFGGHPNERSLTSNLEIDDEGPTKTYKVQYLQGDTLFVQGAMKNLARAGLTALFTFQHTMPERFQLLGLREELQALRRGL